MTIAIRQIVIFASVTAIVVALASWLLMSPIYAFPEMMTNDRESVSYTCNVDDSGKSDPAILNQWRGVRIVRDPNVGAQFLFADGGTIDPTWFNVEIGAIGGSMGLRWAEKDGGERAAILYFSDIISDRGPESVSIDVGDWNRLPKFILGDNWPEVSLYCKLDDDKNPLTSA
jgi:hypothetical protein